MDLNIYIYVCIFIYIYMIYICIFFFPHLQVLRWTKQRFLLRTSATLVQRGSGSLTTEKLGPWTVTLHFVCGCEPSSFCVYSHAHHRRHHCLGRCYAQKSLRNVPDARVFLRLHTHTRLSTSDPQAPCHAAGQAWCQCRTGAEQNLPFTSSPDTNS